MKMSKLSIKAAIKESAGTASITGSGTSWQVHGPYKITDPAGPYTTIGATSYAKARRIATQWRAEVAMFLAGMWCDDVCYAIDRVGNEPGESHSLQVFIAAGVKAHADANPV